MPPQTPAGVAPPTTDPFAAYRSATPPATATPASVAPPQADPFAAYRPPGHQWLGDPTKPASITGPPTLGETIRRSLPETVGALGMALGTEGGPAGIGIGGYIGGQTGKALQQGVRALGYGPPVPPTIAGQQQERNEAGLSQATNAAIGEGLGAVVPGGLLRPPPGAVAAVRANTSEGLGLSLPEALKDTKLGTALSGLQQLAERATGGRMIASSARTNWAPAVRQAFAEGKVTLQDIGAAKGVLEQGADLVDNRPMKAAAQDLIDREVQPRAQAYAGAPPPGTTGRIIIGGQPTDLSTLPPNVQAAVRAAAPAAPQVVPKGASPIVKELYNVVNSPDQVPFNAATAQRGKFWDMSRTQPGMDPTAEQGQALSMHGTFTKTLEDANPAWGQLSHTYNGLQQQISQKFVKKIRADDPASWRAAIADARQSKDYKDITADQSGQAAIQRLKDISAAAARRDPSLPSRGWAPILEGLALGSGHLVGLAASETTSALYTAAMYSPKISNYLVQGFKAPNAQVATVAFTQAIAAWHAGQREEAPPMMPSHAIAASPPPDRANPPTPRRSAAVGPPVQ